MSEVDFKVEAKKVRLCLLDGSFIYGRFPTYSEQREIKKQMDAQDEAGVLAVVIAFMAKMGFPEESLNDLDGESFKDFFVFLLGGKKN
jgi:hypothetical protein